MPNQRYPATRSHIKQTGATLRGPYIQKSRHGSGTRGQKFPLDAKVTLSPTKKLSEKQKQAMRRHLASKGVICRSPDKCKPELLTNGPLPEKVLRSPGKSLYRRVPQSGFNVYTTAHELCTPEQATASDAKRTLFQTQQNNNQQLPNATFQNLLMPTTKSMHAIITRDDLEKAKLRPDNRNQNQVMGNTSAGYHAQAIGFEKGEEFALKEGGSAWEWLHLIAYRICPSNINPQAPENLVCGTNGCNSDMMIVEKFISHLLGEAGVAWVYVDVAATMRPNTHIAEKIDYKITWPNQTTSQIEQKFCSFEPLRFNPPISLSTFMLKTAYGT